MSGTYLAWDGNQYEGSPPDGWYLASDDRWWSPGAGPGPKVAVPPPAPAVPPPAPANYPPPAPAAAVPPPPSSVPPPPMGGPEPIDVGGRSWRISDDGKNGTVSMEAKGLTRVVSKRIGKDDRQFIPYSSIGFVEHDRKRMGRDVVYVHVGATKLEWKVVADAEGFVDAVNQAIA